MKLLRILSPFAIALGALALIVAPLSAAEGAKTKIIKFEATWCGPCQQMKPIFAKVSQANAAEVDFQSVDIDASPSLADTYAVSLLPTVIAVKDGKVIGRITGFKNEKQLIAFVKKHR
jgi:thioredoxin 1